MIAEKRKQANIGIGFGFLLEVTSQIIFSLGEWGIHLNSNVSLTLGLLIFIAGYILVLFGCFSYCEGKGYSRRMGIFGMVGLIGLIVLVCLPDRTKSKPDQPGIELPPPPT